MSVTISAASVSPSPGSHSSARESQSSTRSVAPRRPGREPSPQCPKTRPAPCPFPVRVGQVRALLDNRTLEVVLTAGAVLVPGRLHGQAALVHGRLAGTRARRAAVGTNSLA